MDNQKKQTPSAFERRDFLKVGTAATVGFLARGVLPQTAHALPPLPSNAATPEAMPTRNLGRTGYRVGAFSLWAGRPRSSSRTTKTLPFPSSSARLT